MVAGGIAGTVGTAICGPGCGVAAAAFASGTTSTLLNHYVNGKSWQTSAERGSLSAATGGASQWLRVAFPMLNPISAATGKPANASQAAYASAALLFLINR